MLVLYKATTINIISIARGMALYELYINIHQSTFFVNNDRSKRGNQLTLSQSDFDFLLKRKSKLFF